MRKKKEKGASLDAEVVRLILYVLVIAGLIQLGLFGFSISSQFSNLEYKDTAGDFRRTVAALDAEKVSISELARDYAGWDDARTYVEGTNPGFADENFNAEWVDVAKLDQVMIAAPDAVVLWSGIRTKDEFAQVSKDDQGAGDRRPGSVFTQLLTVPRDKPLISFEASENGIILVCAYPVTSSDYAAPPFGWIIFARRFDAQMVMRVSDRSGLVITLLEQFPANTGKRILKSESITAWYFDKARERSLIVPIQDTAGKPIAAVEAKKLRQHDEPMMRMLVELALSLTIAAALTAVILLLLIRRLAVRPLVRIARHLDLYAEKGSPDMKLGMGRTAGRRDEIGNVADRIDSLLEVLESKRLELETVNTELARLAQIDHLTGLANRRSFDDYAEKQVKRLSRELRGSINKEFISILIADIDHFKLYNDRYGHLAGDNCLRAVAEVLAKAARRPGDLACRYGGEEFILLLPETAIEGAVAVARCILTAVVALKIPHEDSPVHPFLSMSIGVATCSIKNNFNLDKLIESADAAMYDAKRAGRNQLKISE